MKNHAASPVRPYKVPGPYIGIPRNPLEHLALKRQRDQKQKEWRVPPTLLRPFFLMGLCLFPASILRRFWQGLMEMDLWPGSELQLYDALWNLDSLFSIHFHEEAFTRWEDFLVNEIPDGIEQFRHMQGAAFLTGNFGSVKMLEMLKHNLQRFLEESDLIGNAQDLFCERTEEALPGCLIACLSRRGMANGLLAIDQVFLPDKTYEREMWYDAGLISAPLLSDFAGMFGQLGEQMSLEIIADGRPIGEILKNVDWYLDGKSLVVQGVKAGSVVGFSSEMKRQGWKLPDQPALSRPVVKMTESYYCPCRKRYVLKAGHMYGTPVYVCRLTHPVLRPEDIKLARKRIWDALIFAISNNQPPEPMGTAERKFRELRSMLQSKLVFEFDGASGVLFLNEKRLIGGQAARILRRILVEYVENKRTEFEFIRFKYDPGISLNPKKSNFETLFGRIQERLKTVQGVGLIKTERGRFKLGVADRVEIKTV